jgi:hypothetical protein
MEPELRQAVIRICRDAAALLRRDGWVQGMYGPTDPEARGARCAMGAVRSASTEKGMTFTERDAAVRELVRTAGLDTLRYPEDDLVKWNDWPGNGTPRRTADEVIAALDGTATRLEAEAAA